MKLISKLSTLVIATALLSSCAKDLSPNTVVSSDTAGIVYEGTVISARNVTVKDSDELGSSPGLGTLAGGVGGGVLGSQLGKGKGSTLGAVGGVVGGAVLGTLLEDQLKTSTGVEYLVKLNDDNVDTDAITKRQYNGNSKSVGDKIRNSTSTNLKSKVISVVQKGDQPIGVGTHVYVIYNDNRPRIVPAN